MSEHLPPLTPETVAFDHMTGCVCVSVCVRDTNTEISSIGNNGGAEFLHSALTLEPFFQMTNKK